HPRDFIKLTNADAGDEGFRLRPAGPAVELQLVRNMSTGACVFLMEIAPDRGRCGVYVHRPKVCRNFPMTLRNGAVAIRDGVKCGSDMWNLAAMDLTGCRHNLVQGRADKVEHHHMMTTWNALVDAAGQERSVEELFEFVLNGVAQGR